MSKIRSKDTKPELFLRSWLHSNGLRFRLHRKDLPGKPDIVLPKYKTALFVHGCFWHYHADCNEGRIPSSNTNFWKEKLSKNIERDAANQQRLAGAGWRVLVVWECQLQGKQRSQVFLAALLHKITKTK
ncbi:very short patch repair endonuclease [Mucilaginibacter sp. BT774]|uniref:very short patch repair endonuclease n=1 Tax=Mucilaginibacter sp. BT774 TaxID=3062276 RepID=UPI0026751EAB|nr:DNA mismatch endonuclease Vsr [Mucilaginibacter sp. BT774]